MMTAQPAGQAARPPHLSNSSMDSAHWDRPVVVAALCGHEYMTNDSVHAIDWRQIQILVPVGESMPTWKIGTSPVDSPSGAL